MVKQGQARRKPRAAKRPRKPAVDLNQENAALRRELAQALKQQAAIGDALNATADVLKVINRSTFELQPVFEMLVTSAARLCNTDMAIILLRDGDVYRGGAAVGFAPDYLAFLESNPLRIDRGSMTGRVSLEKRIIQVEDVAADPEYRLPEVVTLAGQRTALGVPLLRDGEVIGVIVLARRWVEPFSAEQIELVATFADQAMIAIENTRLLTEQREALEQQTATAEVLQVINASPGELAPVFDVILGKAQSLCGIAHGALHLYEDGKFRAVAVRGAPEAFADRLRQGYIPGPNHPSQLLLRGERFAQVTDWAEIDDPMARAILELSNFRTTLYVPLRKDGTLLGQIAASRQENKPHTEKEIALLESFAAQAVIAMENARLLGELRQRTADLQESLEYQTATSDVLKVISRSTFDLQRVLDTLVQTAAELCETSMAAVAIRQGDVYCYVATTRCSPEYDQALRSRSLVPGRDSIVSRVLLERKVVHIVDAETEPGYAVNIGRVRTLLGVPMFREDEVVGVIGLSRQRVEPFTERQIELMRTFADQAVIAIENARLLGELRQRTDDLARSVEELTATGDVLKIISRSSVDVETVLDTLVETVARLCRADHALIFRRREDDRYHLFASRGIMEEAKEFFLAHPIAPGRGTITGRVALERRAVHIPDVLQDPEYTYTSQTITRARTSLGIPLPREAALVGIFVIARTRVEPFTEKEIELTTTFADQAVIAIENARLFEELRESLEQQTATAEVLQVINTSPGELAPVFDAILDKALRLSHSAFGVMRLFDGTHFQLAAEKNVPPAYLDFTAKRIVNLTGVQALGAAVERVITEKRVIQIVDAKDAVDELYQKDDPMRRAVVDLAGARSILFVPLLNDDVARGTIMVFRTEVKAFSDKEIALLQNFAAQAVIAMDNARLLGELRERQAELRVTFDNMGDGVALFDSEPRLVAWNRNFQEILDLPDALLARHLTYVEYLRMLAERGEFGTLDNIETEVERRVGDLDRPALFARTRPDGKVIEAHRNPVPGGGFVLIYSDITERKRAEAEISAARDAAENALRELQAAQASLLHSQKMAALGQLTAGIAHEIKNPLNFVNNFADLSVELLDELREATADRGAEIDETIGMLAGNLTKIAEHGRRADGIVKSMLAHSRGGSGDRQPTDLNALIEEALNLAYHGARAQDQSFNIAMERDLDRNLAPIEVVPQDLMRVLLNLFGNGFYAANKRRREDDNGFRPTLHVATTDLGEHVEIRVRDNGIGIPPEHRDRLFQPFFTTKPTGEGTGLGLSISYEIVTQQHGGTITVDSELGHFTEFTVRLPRRRHAAGRVA